MVSPRSLTPVTIPLASMVWLFRTLRSSSPPPAPSPTDNDLDCMIDGTGLFLVGPKHDQPIPADDNGIRGSGCYLSRVGIFTIDNNGYLVDNAGNYVYGYPVETDLRRCFPPPFRRSSGWRWYK